MKRVGCHTYLTSAHYLDSPLAPSFPMPTMNYMFHHHAFAHCGFATYSYALQGRPQMTCSDSFFGKAHTKHDEKLILERLLWINFLTLSISDVHCAHNSLHVLSCTRTAEDVRKAPIPRVM